MQVSNSTVLPNTVTPFTATKPAAPATTTYTPSFPPIEQPSALDHARHSPTNPLVYTAKPAAPRPQPSGSEKSEPAGTRSEPTKTESEVAEETKNTLQAVTNGESEEQGEGQGEAYQGLSEQELQEIQELASRDREVRAHEQAHARVGGKYAGAPVYDYERGPDGASYAISGEVPIDVAPIAGDPEATIQKMRQVQRAALAPAEPSGQDRAVAATAARYLLEAQSELMRSRAAESADRDSTTRAEQTVQPDFAAGLGIETYLNILEQGRVFQEQGARPQRLLDVVA